MHVVSTNQMKIFCILTIINVKKWSQLCKKDQGVNSKDLLYHSVSNKFVHFVRTHFKCGKIGKILAFGHKPI